MNPNRSAAGALSALLAVALIAAACGAPASEPEIAVREFYSRLNSGNYSGAKALYDAEARKLLDDPDLASDAGFSAWASKETKQGRVETVNVLSQSGDAGKLTVECEVVYSDGTTKTRTISLTLEDGGWKLGLLG
jgi:hypothetical protein